LIVNFVIGNSASNEQAIVDIVNQEKERRASQKALRDLKEQYKKQDDLTYIDIDKDD
jgi:hypothetical protein